MININDKEIMDKFVVITKNYFKEYKKGDIKINKFDNKTLIYISEIERIIEYELPCDIDKLISLDESIKNNILPIFDEKLFDKETGIQNIHKILIFNSILSNELAILIDLFIVRKMDFVKLNNLSSLEMVGIIMKNLYFDNTLLRLLYFDAVRYGFMNNNILLDENRLVIRWGNNDDIYSVKEFKLYPAFNPIRIIDELDIDHSSLLNNNDILDIVTEVYDNLPSPSSLVKVDNISIDMKTLLLLQSFILITFSRLILMHTKKIFAKMYENYDSDEYTLHLLDCLNNKEKELDEYVKELFVRN
jgi:hypothetical protein